MMELEEAIKRLREDTEHPTAKYLPDLLQAIQLGIEALERITVIREDWHNNQPVIDVIEEAVSKLPSETKEA